MENLIKAKSETAADPAVSSEANLFEAVRGVSHAADGHGATVGVNDNATDTAGPGVFGKSRGTGVWGESETWMGVFGYSISTSGGAGVMGQALGAGVIGESKTWMGVYGKTESITGGAGVMGEHIANGTGTVGKSKGGVGVLGVSETNEGIHAETNSPGTAAIATYNNNPNGTGAAIFAKKEGTQGHAGFFDGDVFITGNLGVKGDITLANADFAEDFTVMDQTEPGEVMVLTEDGTLIQNTKEYDKKVVGVLSGAGSYKPGIILDKQSNNINRKPIAMMGKVFCKVDADTSAIERYYIECWLGISLLFSSIFVLLLSKMVPLHNIYSIFYGIQT